MSPPHRQRHRLTLRGLLVLLVIFGFAACSGEHPHRPPPGATGPGQDATRAPIPKMEAQGTYFDGQIEAEAMLAPAGMKWSRDMESEGSGGGGRSSRASGLRGGMGGGGRGGRGGGRGHGGGGGGPPEGGAEGAAQGPPIHASNLPPIQLRLRLTNHGDAPAVVEVEDFDSTMGDFVVQPSKITIQPGESAEADPMVSRLGVTAEEIALTVKLRSAGRTEQQVLMLRAAKPPPAGAPPEGSPAGPPPAATPAMPPAH